MLERADDAIARTDADAVIITSATPSHAALAVAAARAGKHVYIWKPLALGASEARRVLAAVRDARVVGVVAFNFRAHPLHRRAADLVRRRPARRPARGADRVLRAGRGLGRMPAWKGRRETGGGVLLDLASDHVDSLRWMLSDEVVGVDEARVDSLETEQDVARLTSTLRSGCDVQAYFSFRTGPADYLELIGDRGTLRVDRYRSRLDLRVARRFGYGMRASWVRPGAALAALAARRLARPSYSSRPSDSRSPHSWIASAADPGPWPASRTARARSRWCWPPSSPPAPAGGSPSSRSTRAPWSILVLLVTDWVRKRGGVEAYTAWLRAGLTEAGDEVRLLTSTVGSAGDGLAKFRARRAEWQAGPAPPASREPDRGRGRPAGLSGRPA